MDLSTDLPAETVLTTLHLILDQITEITTAIPTTTTHTTDKATTETTIKTEGTNRIQDLLGMMQTVRGFINFMKANPTTREQFKSNKLAMRKEYNNEVDESDIHSSSLDQVQQLINQDKDIVFDALVAADYIDEIECTDSNNHQQV